MHSFKELAEKFNKDFETEHFPKSPASLYEPGNYFLSIGGKRIRPVMCLLGNELFSDIHPDAYQLANAVELFHNFTLVHDDMMDAATLRRGKTTVHIKYDESTALLVGDVMLIRAYEYIQNVQPLHLPKILQLFNKTAKEVCEGQQLDMDFSKRDIVSMNEYIHMITLKTSVLLAASLEMGAIIGGASVNNCKHLYEFGKKIGIAFQLADDVIDIASDSKESGKTPGTDLREGVPTLVTLHVLESKDKNDEELNRCFILFGPRLAYHGRGFLLKMNYNGNELFNFVLWHYTEQNSIIS